MNPSLVIHPSEPLNTQDSPHHKHLDVGIGIHRTAQATQWKGSVHLLQPKIFVKNPQRVGQSNMKIYWCLPISQITLNKKSRKTPEGINRLLYLVKLLIKS